MPRSLEGPGMVDAVSHPDVVVIPQYAAEYTARRVGPPLVEAVAEVAPTTEVHQKIGDVTVPETDVSQSSETPRWTHWEDA